MLDNAAILLISPQPWNHLHISKHNYAIELVRQGNTVYFLEPPDDNASAPVRVEPVVEYPGLFVVRYRPLFPFALRFHLRTIYDRLIHRQIRAILRAIDRPIDVLWSFEFNLFSDLRAFDARLTIFHPVDRLSEQLQVDVARSADAVFSVSEAILANFRDVETPSWFINHGLSRPFAEAARNGLGHGSDLGTKRVGYSGNLLRPPLNRAVVRQMIEENPSTEFHFWGPYEASPTYPAEPEGDIYAFVSFLRGQPNVRIHGPVPAEELAQQLQLMDCLILAYNQDAREYDRSNAHKVLEYLSTGKVIVASRISAYVQHGELVRMPTDDDDSQLPALLRETLAGLVEFNSVELQDRRRQLALDNTYEKQVDRIRAKLASLNATAPAGVHSVRGAAPAEVPRAGD